MRQAGREPKFRKSDNIALLAQTWKEWAPAWPVLVVEEAQDLSVPSLEELRLLTCSRSDAQQAFSLILSGDDCLLPRLELAINRALLSRITSNLEVSTWPVRQLGDYLDAKLEESSIHGDTGQRQEAEGGPVGQRFMDQGAQHQRRRRPTNRDKAIAVAVRPRLAAL